MPTIFISYRRDDSAGYAGRIHERLASLFGTQSVFIDLDDIPPGVNFVRTIEDQVAACNVMLVLIGRRWLDSRDASGRRRIDDPQDFVRLEVAKGLAQNARVIPVLINNSSMPGERDLPDDLRKLASLQAIALSDERWEYDTGQLVRVVSGGSSAEKRNYHRFVRIAAAAGVLLGAATALILWLTPPPDVSGRWAADVQYDFGGRYTEVFVFRIDEGTLGGTASFLGVARGILDGTIEGSHVSFITRTEELSGDARRQTEHRYRGTVDGDEIRFLMQTEGGFSPHAPVQFVAKRALNGPSNSN